MWRQREIGHRRLDSLMRRTLTAMETQHRKINKTPDNFIELFKVHLDVERNLGSARQRFAQAELRELERLSTDPRVRGIDLVRQGSRQTPDFVVTMQVNNVVSTVRYEVTTSQAAFSDATLRKAVRTKLGRWRRNTTGQWEIRNQLNEAIPGFAFSFSGGFLTIRFSNIANHSPAAVRKILSNEFGPLRKQFPHLRGLRVYHGNRLMAEVP